MVEECDHGLILTFIMILIPFIIMFNVAVEIINPLIRF